VHGIRGELKLRPHNPSSPLPGMLDSLSLEHGGSDREVTLLAARPHGGNWLVRLEGVETRNDAEALVGATIWIDESLLEPLGEGEFYHHQLVGLAVEDEAGTPLGRVRRVMTTGAADVLEIADGEIERLVPMAGDFVQAVDLERGRIVVRPLPGLFE
jgi:16S rRNA processing protein RimM